MKSELLKLFPDMVRIRFFEENILKLFSEGKLLGTTHAYIGQEANAVGVISNLSDKDSIVSNHRCHGHYLAFKKNPYGLLCEMMGKKDGLCGGRGGSQHIFDENIFSNGIQGGIVPLATGLAFSEKYKKTKNIINVFIGDGTLGEGVVYECFNIASKWELPLLIVIENNRYAQSTKIENNLAGSIRNRTKAFDIETEELSSFDVLEINKVSKYLIDKIREDSKPRCLVLNTYRFASHSKSDDGRSQEEVQEWKINDPLQIVENQLTDAEITQIKTQISNEINSITKRALEAPFSVFI
jgi:TPP-dependent pyruvate/acetoin dehydrogenase alpha subunit